MPPPYIFKTDTKKNGANAVRMSIPLKATTESGYQDRNPKKLKHKIFYGGVLPEFSNFT